jgi:hypothetical protein
MENINATDITVLLVSFTMLLIGVGVIVWHKWHQE